jgi:hypothetical protein
MMRSTYSDHARESIDQHVLRPLLHGVAYDTAGERVFISSCPREEYECDLLVVNVGQVGGEATRFRSDERFGYTWPAVSLDGRRLAIVRSPRTQHPNTRDLQQSLLEIDLVSGAERVLATSEGGRFDRLQYTPSGLLVLRSFRSSEDVQCDLASCVDWAEYLLFNNDAQNRLPIEAAAGQVPGFSLSSLIPLADGRFWIEGSSREETVQPSGLVTRRGYAWLLEADGRLLGPARNLTEMQALIADVPLGGWRVEQLIGGRVGRAEQDPFDATQGDALNLNGISLAGPTRGAYVRKERRNGRFILSVEAIALGSDGVWRSQWRAEAEFPH